MKKNTLANLAKLCVAMLVASGLLAITPIGNAAAATTSGTVYVPCDPADNHPAFIGADLDIYVTPGETLTFVSTGNVNCTEFAYWYPDNPALPVFTSPAVTNNVGSTKTYVFPANGQFTVNSDAASVGQSTTMYVVKNDAGFDLGGPFWGQRYNVHVVADDCAALAGSFKLDIDGKCKVTLTAATASFTVPTGVTQLFVTATGGTGAAESQLYSVPNGPVGGRAARIKSSIAASPGDVVQVVNQTKGGTAYTCSNWVTPADFGYAGNGGGAASVTINSTPTAIFTVGGGGGAGCSTNFATVLTGGSGGDAGLSSGNAADGSAAQFDAGNDVATVPGAGATQYSGGTGYPNNGSHLAGGDSQPSSEPGGAGGSGYFGGGCGERGHMYRAGSGGGGGSSFLSGFAMVSEQLVRTGTTASSVEISFVAPPVATVPDAPTIGTPAITGTTTANVPFTAPASDGGSAIDYYELDSTPTANGDLLFQAGSGTIAATLLTANTDYTFKVRAHNSVGNSLFSSSSTTVTTLPNAPTASATTASTGSLSVPFVAGAAGGGATITGYSYSATAVSPAGGTLTGSCGSVSPCVISGLTNGTTYSVTITAQNAGGSSAASNAVTGTPAAPGGGGSGSAPVINRVKGEKEQTKVYFTPGTQTGITSYRYSINNGEWQRATGISSPIVIKAKLKRYTLRIRSVAGNVLSDISASFNVRD